MMHLIRLKKLEGNKRLRVSLVRALVAYIKVKTVLVELGLDCELGLLFGAYKYII